MWRDFITFYLMQATTTSLITFNIWAVSHTHHLESLISNAIYASVLFVCVRRISHTDDQHALVCGVGYVAGSLTGTTIGMLIPRWLS